MSTLVDTDILIDAAKDITQAVECLRELESVGDVLISSVTEMELVVGCRNKAELRDLEKFLTRFTMVALSDAISDMATNLLKQYRLSHGLLIPDGLIAATTIISDYSLISKNQRDYRFIESLNLLPYPPQ